MAVKVLIRRMVPRSKAKKLIPLFRQIRMLARNQKGYISEETLRNLENPEDFLIISIWNCSNDWKNWLNKKERKEIQATQFDNRKIVTGLARPETDSL